MRKQYFLITSMICGMLLASGSSLTLNSTAKELDAQKVETMEKKELDLEKKYEYYLTRDALLADIEQGIIFRIDTAFQKPMCPIVTGGNWAFYVHENNVVNLEISYSDLIAKNGKYFYPYREQVVVDVLSPDGDCAYHFEKLGDEIMQNTSIQEQIVVTPGEWTLQIGFAYVCDEAQSPFKICAAYESPSEEDIQWLREARIGENDVDTRNAKQEDNAANFEAPEEKKEPYEEKGQNNICK